MSRFPLVFTRRFPPEPVVPEYRPRPHRHLCGACPLTPHRVPTGDQDTPRGDGVSGSGIRPPWFDQPFAEVLSPPGGPPARIFRLLAQVDRVDSHVACVSRSSTVMRVSSYTSAVAARK
jgi:hypothetical protein